MLLQMRSQDQPRSGQGQRGGGKTSGCFMVWRPPKDVRPSTEFGGGGLSGYLCIGTLALARCAWDVLWAHTRAESVEAGNLEDQAVERASTVGSAIKVADR
jgi:hypothetical protein